MNLVKKVYVRGGKIYPVFFHCKTPKPSATIFFAGTFFFCFSFQRARTEDPGPPPYMLSTGFEHSVRSSSFFHPLPETETMLCHHKAGKKKKAKSIQGHTAERSLLKLT